MATESDALTRAVNSVDIRNVQTLEDALALFEGKITEASSLLGDGCEMLKEKDQLIDKPFLILEAREIEGDFGAFWTVACMTEGGKKYRFNDGSTGIAAQLAALGTDGRVTGLMCRHGLTRSDYEVEVNGKLTEASTYYISESA